MLVYRIVFKAYSKTLTAPGFSGRWNGEGRKLIYTAESISLAFLENMIRRKGVGFNDDFKTMVIHIPDTLVITTVNMDTLPGNWRDFNDYTSCQVIGNAWYDNNESAVLRAPSAVLPGDFNYILNTLHPDYRKITLIETTNLVPDIRIEEILKKYPAT
jgi:RES domain-containing protein